MRQPGAPLWEVADIFRLYGATSHRTHPVPPTHPQVMHAIEVCRTAQLGGHAAHCPTCGFERYAYNSCRKRHCPKCQTFTKVQWVEDRKAELLPVPYYFQTVVMESHQDIHVHFLILTFFGLSITAACPPTAN